MSDADRDIPEEVEASIGNCFKIAGYKHALRCTDVKWNDVIQGWSLVVAVQKKKIVHIMNRFCLEF